MPVGEMGCFYVAYFWGVLKNVWVVLGVYLGCFGFIGGLRIVSEVF